MVIRYATKDDLETLLNLDQHICKRVLRKKILDKEVIVAEDNHVIKGWIRYNLFWDSIPFINMIYVVNTHERHHGIGSKLLNFFELEIRSMGYDKIMTSSMACEFSQHFFRKRGYRDCGSMLIEIEGMELLFIKMLGEKS